MRQGLVIKIVKDQKAQAAVYYTRNGRTLLAFMDACKIVKALNDTDDLILQLYRFVSNTTGTVEGKTVHGGVMKSDHDEFLHRYADKVTDANNLTGDGSCGLLAVSTSAIRRMERGAVMDITLNLDNHKAYMANAYSYMSGHIYEIIFRKEPETLLTPPCDPDFIIPFAELPVVMQTIEKDGGQDYYDSANDVCCICVRYR